MATPSKKSSGKDKTLAGAPSGRGSSTPTSAGPAGLSGAIAQGLTTSGPGQASRPSGSQEQGAQASVVPVGDGETGPTSSSAIEALKQDHRRVEQLFADYESALEDSRKDEVLRQVCIELIIHTKLEEEIFYPASRAAVSDEEMFDQAQVEHDSAKLLIADLLQAASSDPFRDAKVKVLKEQIKHHVGEEEKPGDGIFAQAEEHNLDTAELARRLKERKETLQGRAAELRPTRAVSINLEPYFNAEDSMARNGGSSGRERDERGRFMSDDDDDRDYRRSSGRGSSSRDDDDNDRGSRERDERGRFMSDDDDRDYRRSSGRGSRSRDDDDNNRGRRERDERGRFMSDDDDREYRRGSGRSSGGRSQDDDDRGGRGRGGWFGDSEGHSEAARRRWEDDDDRSGSRSRGRDDDDDERAGRGRGRGWFGDSEGHAEAARRRREDDDDPRGGSRSRSSKREDDEDRRGGSRSRGGSNEEHGGWFGDSRRHAQAARRGWQSRR